MMIVALEASTARASAALLEVKREQIRVVAARSVLWARPSEVGPVALVAKVVEATGRGLRAVDAFAVGLGPGEGVGLDDAVLAVRSLALANQRPFTGVSSLEALAHAGRGHVTPGTTLLPLVAAGEQFFLGFYRVGIVGPLQTLRREEKVTRAQLFRICRQHPRAVGVGIAWEACGIPSVRSVTHGCALPEAGHVGAAAAPALRSARGPDIRAAYQVRPRESSAREAPIG